MRNLTTSQAVLGGLALMALAIASIPYSTNTITPAHASEIQKVALSDVKSPSNCPRALSVGQVMVWTN
jgi:hypothetical protein